MGVARSPAGGRRPGGTAVSDDEVDLCVIGSGAGGAPVALRAAEAGLRVVVLEKGPHLREEDFERDEIRECRRYKYTPRPSDEPSVVELFLEDGSVERIDSRDTPGWSLWNGSLVGGATNLMSGFFYRKKTVDFAPVGAFGKNHEEADWPLSYEDLEPFYAEVEEEIGVSGRATPHAFTDPRSTADFPLPPLLDHPVADRVDRAARSLGLHPFPVPRAILSRASGERGSCSYSGYCAAYGCMTGAKGSARAALLRRAVATGRCEVRPQAMVRRIESDPRGRVVAAVHGAADRERRVRARAFVVACQPVETARLLLLSPGERHPNGLANRSGLVGRHLHFPLVVSGQGDLWRAALPGGAAARQRSPWINRAVQDHYVLRAPPLGPPRIGGTFHFLFEHPNLIDAAASLSLRNGVPLPGEELVRRIRSHFQDTRTVSFETFAHFTPNPDTRVTLDTQVKDRFGLPVACVRIRALPEGEAACAFLADEALAVLGRLGARALRADDPGPSTNLAAGTCRFGDDPRTSVLDRDCRAHDVENLFVTDASFMPSGGGAPHTFTVYANAFRVAREVVRQLGGKPARKNLP